MCGLGEGRNRDKSERSSLKEHKVIIHLQRKILFSLLGNFANGEGEISRRWEYPFFAILLLLRVPL